MQRVFVSQGGSPSAHTVASSDFPEYMCGITASYVETVFVVLIFRDARKGGSGRGRATSSRGPGLVKGEASLRSGRQTAYRRKAGSRNNVDMGDDIGRLDGRKSKDLFLASLTGY